MDTNEREYDFPFNYLYKVLVFFLTKVIKISTLLVLVSNIAWIAMAFYCLKKYNERHRNDLMQFAYVTFVISAMNSAMNITELFYENVMTSMRSLLELLLAALAFPCLTTAVWLNFDVAQKEVAWLHTVIGLIPTYIFLFQHYTRQDLIDFTVVMNMVSLIGVGFLYQDLFAMAASVLFFLCYCGFFFRSELVYEPGLKQIFNYCMAAFTFCGYKAVT
ncbi:hypothetical protein TcasGA2_TC033071 [Tribolium castaneum]|uniref:Uncharacterized protein n=1 Tax=Tribolium castaneum TaxID=7070 RepID=A0A139WIM7_TRICA|nr:PREDICTED: uncharacterized protein LOC103312987 [Tribolium castaneum]KYB27627.1 hypothetical protein TcasGA2_TC033071 [Tribolium castaneum]|eukprot:XP_008193241.2 PREDICTED: uncharacterized protein LOC103312987 [Tribolium castaneum]